MKSDQCHRVYLTKVHGVFECDTFFPAIPEDFKLVTDSDVQEEVQEENGIKYQYKIYEKQQ
jgi:dihydrofolate reductase